MKPTINWKHQSRRPLLGLAFLCLILVLSLLACGDSAPAEEVSPAPAPASEANPVLTPQSPTAGPLSTAETAETSLAPTALATPTPPAETAAAPTVALIPTAAPSTTAGTTPAPAQGPTAARVQLPQDEGPHPTPIEWWYFNGHLTDEAGGEYSFHFVTFEIVTPQGIVPRVLQLSWADHRAGLFQTDERFAIGAFAPDSPDAPQPGSFSVTMADWTMAGDGDQYDLAFQTGEYSLELQALSRKPAALHNQTGLLDLGPAGRTYYYTRPRLETSGVLTVNGESRPVTGIAWFDHQWGDSATALDVGWDWLSLQLDDGSEVMVSLVWDGPGDDRSSIAEYGTYIPPDYGQSANAAAVHLPEDDITLTPTGSWVSPANGAVYPMGWQLEIASIPLSVSLEPASEDSEMAASSFIPLSYWEGAVAVQGNKEGSTRHRPRVRGVGGLRSPRPPISCRLSPARRLMPLPGAIGFSSQGCRLPGKGAYAEVFTPTLTLPLEGLITGHFFLRGRLGRVRGIRGGAAPRPGPGIGPGSEVPSGRR